MHKEIFDAAHGRLGLGCMRFPTKADGNIDTETVRQMVDLFMREGFNYFDTAHGYLDGRSERMVRTCLTTRYPRDSYLLADKLSPNGFEHHEEIRPLIEDQLRACGVDYLDYYLMHSQGPSNYDKYQRCGAYDEALAARDAGLVRHVGFSFHSDAAFLDRILTDHPDMEFVQLQVNYLDWESGVIQSHACCEVAAAHGKPVVVMEPVKGGMLVNLPDEAREALAAAGPGSPASYALRFAASLPGVEMVLSGMGTPAMVEENVRTFSPLVPLAREEHAAVERVAQILRGQGVVECTGCRYCVDGCPKRINIPELFSCLNAKRGYNEDSAGYYYRTTHTGNGHGLASECVGCGACERACPQHLPIRELLREVAAEFETDSEE